MRQGSDHRINERVISGCHLRLMFREKKKKKKEGHDLMTAVNLEFYNLPV
jgi:hypothetical protein